MREDNGSMRIATSFIRTATNLKMTNRVFLGVSALGISLNSRFFPFFSCNQHEKNAFLAYGS